MSKSTDIDGLFFDRPEDPVDSRLSILRLRKTLKRARMPWMIKKLTAGEFEWISQLPKDLIHLPLEYTWVVPPSKFFRESPLLNLHFFIYILILFHFMVSDGNAKSNKISVNIKEF